jgi:hypothetical protein
MRILRQKIMSLRHLWSTTLLIGLLGLHLDCMASESLYIFYPSTARPQVIQKLFSQTAPEVDVTVFGRYRDFFAFVEKEPPDAILTKAAVIDALGRYSVKLTGSRNGIVDEPFVFLSVGEKVELKQMSNLTIGMFDMLGRKGMQDFVAPYLTPSPRLERVSKLEDLLSLLTFNMVDAVLIPEIQVNYFQTISNLQFQVTQVPQMRSAIIALAVRENKEAKAIIQALSRLNEQVMSLLEVTNWNQ